MCGSSSAVAVDAQSNEALIQQLGGRRAMHSGLRSRSPTMPAMPLTLILLVRYLFCSRTCRNYVSNSLRCCLASGWCDWLPLLARMPEGRDCTSTPCSPQAALSDETGRNRDETATKPHGRRVKPTKPVN